jgi:hypothetical protein
MNALLPPAACGALTYRHRSPDDLGSELVVHPHTLQVKRVVLKGSPDGRHGFIGADGAPVRGNGLDQRPIVETGTHLLAAKRVLRGVPKLQRSEHGNRARGPRWLKRIT